MESSEKESDESLLPALVENDIIVNNDGQASSPAPIRKNVRKSIFEGAQEIIAAKRALAADMEEHNPLANAVFTVSSKSGLFFAASASKNKEDPMRILTDLKEAVKRLESVECLQTPSLAALETKVLQLGLASEEMRPSVQMLTRNVSKVNDTVLSIEALEHQRQGVEEEKWKANEEKLEMKHDKFESSLSSCLRSKDLAAERNRVDARINSLKADLESVSSDQMRNLKSVMGSEVGKVIEHVTKIKTSFDHALDFMRKRVEAMADDFQAQQQELTAANTEKGDMKQEMHASGLRQERTETAVLALQTQLGSVVKTHGADIAMLQQDMEQAMEQQQALADRIAQHEADTKEGLEAVKKRVDELEKVVHKRIALSHADSVTYADEAVDKVWKGVLTELAKTKEEHSSKGTEFVGVTESLQVKLSELEALRAASMGELSQQLKAQNEATEALRAHADLGLLNVRNDTQRTVERNSEEIGRLVASLTEQRLAEMRVSLDQELEGLSQDLSTAKELQDAHGSRINVLETRQTSVEESGGKLHAAFSQSEVARAGWQRNQDSATRNFRNELDSHLHEMEEQQNEKVSQSREDVVRLGRSNVALAAIVHQCRSRMMQLASHEEAAAQWKARLEAYSESTTIHATREEGTASVERPFLFSVPFQKFVSGAVLNIAEVISLLADNDTVRSVLVHPDPADPDMGWDRMVDETRGKLMREFIAKVYSLVAEKHPSIHPVILQARTKIFTKFELSLKIALSKHASVTPSTTILGRRALDACAACNRPMKLPTSSTTSAQPNSGSSGSNNQQSSISGDPRALAKGGMAGALLGNGERAVSAGWSPGRQRPATATTATNHLATSGDNALHWASAYEKEVDNALVKFKKGAGVGGGGGGLLGSGALGFGEKPDRGGGGGYQQGSNGAGGKYIMRGGFRMPKKELPSQTGGNNNFPGLLNQHHGGDAMLRSSLPARPGTAPNSRR